MAIKRLICRVHVSFVKTTKSLLPFLSVFKFLVIFLAVGHSILYDTSQQGVDTYLEIRAVKISASNTQKWILLHLTCAKILAFDVLNLSRCLWTTFPSAFYPQPWIGYMFGCLVALCTEVWCHLYFPGIHQPPCGPYFAWIWIHAFQNLSCQWK